MTSIRFPALSVVGPKIHVNCPSRSKLLEISKTVDQMSAARTKLYKVFKYAQPMLLTLFPASLFEKKICIRYNISLMHIMYIILLHLALSVSDLCCLVTLSLMNIGFTPDVVEADLPFDPKEVVYLVAATPHFTFSRVTSWITAFITMERCLCVLVPLKVVLAVLQIVH